MLISPSPPSSMRPDTVHQRAPAEKQAATEGTSKSSAVTLDLSSSAIALAKEALRLAQERQAKGADSSPPVASPPPQQPKQHRLTVVEALDPDEVHREELKALLTTHTGTQLYVIKRTLEALLGDPNKSEAESEEHEAEAKVRREAMHVVGSIEGNKAPKVPVLEPIDVPVPIEYRSTPPAG